MSGEGLVGAAIPMDPPRPDLPAGSTLTIDDPDAGGSEPGAWVDAIAHTPHLAAQFAAEQETQVND